MIARAVWDREVEGLSPFTPTIEKDHRKMVFFYGPRRETQTFDFYALAENSRRFGEAQRSSGKARFCQNKQAEEALADVLSFKRFIYIHLER